MDDVKRETSRGVSRRKTATNLTFCAKKERDTKYRKVYLAVQKNETDRTEEERELMRTNVDMVKKATESQKKREEVKARSEEVEDPEEILISKCAELAAALRNSRHLVVYTGAGISTAAKIPDYRGTNGIWTLLQKGKDIGNHDLSRAEPTLTHMALFQLYSKGILKYVVSQNCDGLHLRSGLPRSALSEVHGNMHLEVCCECRPGVQYWRIFDVTENTARFSHRTMRRCHICHSALNDTIVHFGERGNLPWPLNWPGACKAADNADVILCIGSSLKVLKKYPWLWGMDRPVRKRPKLYIVNLQWTPKDDQAALKINGRCDRVMQEVMRCLEIPVPAYDRLRDPIFCHATHLHPDEGHTTSQPELDSPFKKEEHFPQDLTVKKESEGTSKRESMTVWQECPLKVRKFEDAMDVASAAKIEEILEVDVHSTCFKIECDIAGIEMIDVKNEAHFLSCLSSEILIKQESTVSTPVEEMQLGSSAPSEGNNLSGANESLHKNFPSGQAVCATVQEHCSRQDLIEHCSCGRNNDCFPLSGIGSILVNNGSPANVPGVLVKESTSECRKMEIGGCESNNEKNHVIVCPNDKSSMNDTGKEMMRDASCHELAETLNASPDPVICSKSSPFIHSEGTSSIDGKENVDVHCARLHSTENASKVMKKNEIEKPGDGSKECSVIYSSENLFNASHSLKAWASIKVQNSVTDSGKTSTCDTVLDPCLQAKTKSLKVNGGSGESFDEIGVLRMLQLEHNYSKSCIEKYDDLTSNVENSLQEAEKSTQQSTRTSSRVREKQNAIQAQAEAKKNAKTSEKSPDLTHSSTKREKVTTPHKNKKLTKADFEMRAELKSWTCSFCVQFYGSPSCLFYPSLDLHPRKLDGCICECCDYSSESDGEVEEVEEGEEDGSGVDATDNADEGTSKSSFINPGWYGKGYRKKFRKKK